MTVDALQLASYVCQAYDEAEAGSLAPPRDHLGREGVADAFKFLIDAGNAVTLEAFV